jgi:hypothetical protein
MNAASTANITPSRDKGAWIVSKNESSTSTLDVTSACCTARRTMLAAAVAAPSGLQRNTPSGSKPKYAMHAIKLRLEYRMQYILSSELVRLDRNDTTSNDTRDIRNTEALSNNDVVPKGTMLAAALYARNTRTISIAEYVNVSKDEYSGNCIIKA